ncbi:hypothetical protein PSMK_01840 [Phycisphaera mikurensis NBRC 102666]|uniref:Uncharacterized protein n=1 Tax=Phycisphaera mikurensis (strain NBRC 102666 / KCTC 22515 / FYK2301M01) TaxID=1142394 RepID=I0IAQ5_PHYMF|nr:hypothetical protein PSMK_01840 [Phycisphaera mikurensis NBRC 102666]
MDVAAHGLGEVGVQAPARFPGPGEVPGEVGEASKRRGRVLAPLSRRDPASRSNG